MNYKNDVLQTVDAILYILISTCNITHQDWNWLLPSSSSFLTITLRNNTLY